MKGSKILGVEGLREKTKQLNSKRRALAGKEEGDLASEVIVTGNKTSSGPLRLMSAKGHVGRAGWGFLVTLLATCWPLSTSVMSSKPSGQQHLASEE